MVLIDIRLGTRKWLVLIFNSLGKTAGFSKNIYIQLHHSLTRINTVLLMQIVIYLDMAGKICLCQNYYQLIWLVCMPSSSKNSSVFKPKKKRILLTDPIHKVLRRKKNSSVAGQWCCTTKITQYNFHLGIWTRTWRMHTLTATRETKHLTKNTLCNDA